MEEVTRKIKNNKVDITILESRLFILEKQLNCDGFHSHEWVNYGIVGMFPLQCKHCKLKQFLTPAGAIKYGN